MSIRVLLFIHLLFAGCAHYSTPVIDNDFDGIVATAASARNVRVLFVHGMGEHRPGYAGGLVNELASRLDLRISGDPEQRTIRYPGSDMDGAIVRIWRYSNGAKQEFRLYELTWSPLTTPVKQRLLGYDREPEYRFHRSVLNRALKEDLVDWKLSDAILYLGQFRRPMEWVMTQGICHALNDAHRGDGECNMAGVDVAGLERDQFVFVSASLGSRMLFDALELLQGQAQTREIATTIVARTNQLFMMANQLPLLQLARVDRPLRKPRPDALAEPETSKDSLSDFMDFWMRVQEERQGGRMTPENAVKRRLQIVAFSDPNDLLSFTIPANADYIRPEIAVSNVLVSNTGEILGLVARPDKAHTGYDENPKVWDLLICGSRGLRAACEGPNR